MPPTTSTRDAQRSRVYAAEQAWADRLDAARRGARRAVVAGSAVLLPVEVLFGTLAAAQEYASAQLVPHDVPAVVLRPRRGHRRAHWQAPATVALPLTGPDGAWAMREAVLLHELAHHLAFHLDGEAGHGPAFPARLLALVTAALGPEAAFALQVEYAESGVEVAA